MRFVEALTAQRIMFGAWLCMYLYSLRNDLATIKQISVNRVNAYEPGDAIMCFALCVRGFQL